MSKQKIFFWLRLLAEWGVSVGLVRWLVGGSWWLALFLGSAMANVAEIYRRIWWNRRLFGIADSELVRVSALANGLEESVFDLKDNLRTLREELDDLKDKTVDSGHHFDERMALYISKRIADVESRVYQLEARLKRGDIEGE